MKVSLGSLSDSYSPSSKQKANRRRTSLLEKQKKRDGEINTVDKQVDNVTISTKNNTSQLLLAKHFKQNIVQSNNKIENKVNTPIQNTNSLVENTNTLIQNTNNKDEKDIDLTDFTESLIRSINEALSVVKQMNVATSNHEIQIQNNMMSKKRRITQDVQTTAKPVSNKIQKLSKLSSQPSISQPYVKREFKSIPNIQKIKTIHPNISVLDYKRKSNTQYNKQNGKTTMLNLMAVPIESNSKNKTVSKEDVKNKFSSILDGSELPTKWNLLGESLINENRGGSELGNKMHKNIEPINFKTYTETSPSHLPTNLPSHQLTYLPSHLPTNLPSHLPTNLPSHLLTNLPSHQPTQLPTDLPINLLTHIRTQNTLPTHSNNRPRAHPIITHPKFAETNAKPSIIQNTAKTINDAAQRKIHEAEVALINRRSVLTQRYIV
jgi:hypothetical protein